MDVPAPSARLLGLVLDALGAQTSVTLVGLPGSGRTTLLDRVAHRAADEEHTVVRVSGTGRDRPALEALVLAGLISTPPARAVGLAAASEEVTRALGGRAPLLLVDDADDLDESSRVLLAAAARARGAAVAATVRPPAVDAGLADDATVLPVPLLAFEDVHRMAADLLGGGEVEADVVGRVYALSGGLPGIAHALVREARRDDRLVRRDGWWTAPSDLWTPALAVVVDRLLRGLGGEERAAVEVLAALGPTAVATVRRLLPWSVLVTLDDRGLVRFLELGDERRVALFPPLLTEHLRHTGGGARGLRALDAVDAALGATPGLRPAVAPDPVHDASPAAAPGSAAVLGRLLREQAATRLLVSRDAWDREPSNRSAVAYLDALLAVGADPAEIAQVLERSRALGGPAHAGRARAFVDAWEASYRGLVLREPLDDAGTGPAAPGSDAELEARLLAAVRQHVALVVGPDRPEQPPSDVVPPDAGSDDHARRRAGLMHLIDGETLLARGRALDAGRAFAKVTLLPEPSGRDLDSLVAHALLCAGEVRQATDRSARLLDEARGTLDVRQIEPHGYVAALGLYLQGRLATLRTHLTYVFALNTPSPLRPCTRAGLLGIGAALSLVDRNEPSARSLASQLDQLGLLAAFTPLARPQPHVAALAAAAGRDPSAAAAEAWAHAEALAGAGHVLAAVTDAAELVATACDPARARSLGELGERAQGTVLPALGRYLRASASGRADALLEAAALLRDRGLELYATRAHVAAVRAWRRAGDAAAATREAAALRDHVRAVGDDLPLLTRSLGPASHLTPRELEIARLVAAGATNRDVAERLLVSERTVDNHLYRVFRKLGVSSREEIGPLL